MMTEKVQLNVIIKLASLGITPRRACAQRGKVIGCVCRYIMSVHDKNTDFFNKCCNKDDEKRDLSLTY